MNTKDKVRLFKRIITICGLVSIISLLNLFLPAFSAFGESANYFNWIRTQLVDSTSNFWLLGFTAMLVEIMLPLSALVFYVACYAGNNEIITKFKKTYKTTNYIVLMCIMSVLLVVAFFCHYDLLQQSYNLIKLGSGCLLFFIGLIADVVGYCFCWQLLKANEILEKENENAEADKQENETEQKTQEQVEETNDNGEDDIESIDD